MRGSWFGVFLGFFYIFWRILEPKITQSRVGKEKKEGKGKPPPSNLRKQSIFPLLC